MEPDSVSTWQAVGEPGEDGQGIPNLLPRLTEHGLPELGGHRRPLLSRDFFFFLLFIATTKANFKIKAINHNHTYFTILFFVLTFLRTVGIRMYIKLWVLFSPLIRYCREFSKSLHNPPERWAEDRVGPRALATVTGHIAPARGEGRGRRPPPHPPPQPLALSHT